MLKRQKNNVFVVGLVAILYILTATPEAKSQPDIQLILFETKKNYAAGTLETDPYDVGALVFGTGMNSVQVTSPADITETLELGPGYWMWDREEKYATLEDLRQDFPTGLYEFTFNEGEASEDSAMVFIDPLQPTGFANITYPADGDTNVPLSPTFTWDPCLGCGDNLLVGVSDFEGDTDLYMEGLNIGQTSWSPGPLVMGRLCGFSVHVQKVGGLSDTTANGDAFDLRDVFRWKNRITFTTEPAPSDLVEIDIKPGSYPNSINPKARGVIPVAILTTEDFNASTVDPSTVALEGVLAKEKGKSSKHGSLEDVDADGDLDLVVQIPNTIDWADDATEATLTGNLKAEYGGDPIEGTDSVRIVPPEQ